jgi:hypothetical protein
VVALAVVQTLLASARYASSGGGAGGPSASNWYQSNVGNKAVFSGGPGLYGFGSGGQGAIYGRTYDASVDPAVANSGNGGSGAQRDMVQPTLVPMVVRDIV